MITPLAGCGKHGNSLCASQEVELLEPFVTTLGHSLHRVRVRVEVHGDLALPASRTVVIFPSFSHSAHVASNSSDPSSGWWQDVVGPGKPVDTSHFRVVCISVLGSPYSPTNPTALDPGSLDSNAAGTGGGRQYRARFPQVTPTDLASCHYRVLRGLGIIGPGSYTKRLIRSFSSRRSTSSAT